jgi:hypothetical protein
MENTSGQGIPKLKVFDSDVGTVLDVQVRNPGIVVDVDPCVTGHFI